MTNPLLHIALAAEITAVMQWTPDITILVVIANREERKAFAALLADLCDQPLHVPGIDMNIGVAVQKSSVNQVLLENWAQTYIAPLSQYPVKGVALNRAYIPKGDSGILDKLLLSMQATLWSGGTLIRY